MSDLKTTIERLRRLHAEATEEIGRLRERLEDTEIAGSQAIGAIVRMGHTEHCAKRLAWGDGECTCAGRGRLEAAVDRFLSEDEGAVLVHPGTDEDNVRLDVPTDTWEGLCEALTAHDTRKADSGEEQP